MSAYRAAWLDLGDAGARAAYADLHAASPQRSVFTSLAFADALTAAYGLPGRLALVHDGEGAGGALAGLVVYEKRRGPYRAAALPIYTKYVAPILRAPQRLSELHRHQSPLDALLDALPKRFHQIALRLHPSTTDTRPYAWHGMTVWPEYQYDIDLAPEGPLPARWRKDLRKAFRKHHDAYVIEQGPACLDAVLRLEAASMGRKDLVTAETAALRTLIHCLAIADVAHVLVARRRETGAAEAGVVAPYDARTGYSWMMGSVPGPAMTVLLGVLAERLRAQGCRWLCLGGANVPSVAEFKRGFDPVLTPYYRVRLVTRPELRLRDAVAAVFGRR